ncbi:MAG: 4Fe-4S binding protein, partial [Candidatus Cloacimonetes bacterium]|nr:4Fe-4S binding protein [Candidatus Cloacimonadota bacterium]
GSSSIPALDTVASRMMGLKIKDVPYLWDALHMEGIIPSQIQVPHSFLHHSIPGVDTRIVKLSKTGLIYLPKALRYAFKQVYYYYPVVSSRCVRCGVCVRSCPVEAVSWQDNGYPMVNRDKCIKCMCCHELCPTQAIDIHKSFIAQRFTR